MPRSRLCQVHTHSYVTAHEHHHVQPLSRGGWNDPSNMIWLCANAHGDVHFYLDLIEKHRGPERVPFATLKHYSPAVRRVARRGWSGYAEDFLSGKYARHAYLWSTSGQPRGAEDGEDHPRLLTDSSVAKLGGVPPYSVALRRIELPYWLGLVPNSAVEQP